MVKKIARIACLCSGVVFFATAIGLLFPIIRKIVLVLEALRKK